MIKESLEMKIRMQGLSRKRKILYILIFSAIVIFLIVMTQSTFMIHGPETNRHFKLSAKPSTQSEFSSREDRNPMLGSLWQQKRKKNHGTSLQKTYHMTANQLSKASLVDELAAILDYKISNFNTEETKLLPVCQSQAEVANSCDGSECLRTSFSVGMRDRVSELVTPKKLQISSEVETALADMAGKVTGNVEFMILSAVSSNHFQEIQAFLRNVHQNVFPHFKNFTLVVYDIGLTHDERSDLVRFCKCQVVDFPLDRFPEFVSKNRCYSWKPIIIKAHLKQAEVTVWADSSIRFDPNPTYLTSLLKRAKKRGVQLGGSRVVSPFRTFRSMYHYFGDEPCMYLNMYQVQATVGLYTREFFVDRAVLEPWVACAVTKSCMCPVKKPKKTCEESDKMADVWRTNNGPIVYGLCHRFDQSAISLILHKLYQESFQRVNFHVISYMTIRREERFAYFDFLKKA